MERKYWKKMNNEWVNFFTRKEREEPIAGQLIQVVKGVLPWKAVDVTWVFKQPGNVFTHFNVYVA